jgi:Spondin_N
MKSCWKNLFAAMCFVVVWCIPPAAEAVDVRVTIENLSGPTGIGFSPLVAAAHNGTVDTFNNGSSASAGVEAVAELGSPTMAIDEILAMQASAVAAPVMNSDSSISPLLPGAKQSVVLSLDPVNNRYFSYLSMAVPSNDAFIGNDSPTAIELFDAGGNFVGQNFTLAGNRIWDAGTEINGLTGSLFIQGQDGSLSPAENGVVHPADLAALFGIYVDETTIPGYVFSGGPAAETPIATISFSVVPEPAGAALVGLGMIGVLGLFGKQTFRR